DEHRAEGGERVERLAAAPLAAALLDLPVARADVVGARVAEHVFERVFRADVLAAASDDDREFALVVDLVAGEYTGNLDGRAGREDGVRALGKDHGPLGNLGAGLLRVAPVVEADAPDHGRVDRAQEFGRTDGGVGGLAVAVQVA